MMALCSTQFGPSSVKALHLFPPFQQFVQLLINFLLDLLKACESTLTLDVVPFLFTNPILSNNSCAQCLLRCTWPPYSISIFPLLANNKPFVAAITMWVVIALPPSHTLVRYCWTFLSTYIGSHQSITFFLTSSYEVWPLFHNPGIVFFTLVLSDKHLWSYCRLTD